MSRSDDGQWICWVEDCCQLFGNQILLKKHLHNVHNIGPYVTEYICPESGCLKVFESKKLCRDHVRSAHGDYRCNVCGKRFQSRGSWKKHEKVHEGYKCSQIQRTAQARGQGASVAVGLYRVRQNVLPAPMFEKTSTLSHSLSEYLKNTITTTTATEPTVLDG
ncbi:zinc finger protein [Trichinella spiralis]|uniref:zinc finger protein n=1 Tax=Trichinella spiralis TaxID=6334 RepID=UPI0001EFC4EA|nr:zinc finger protein [Trichinella spiralis]